MNVYLYNLFEISEAQGGQHPETFSSLRLFLAMDGSGGGGAWAVCVGVPALTKKGLQPLLHLFS